MAKTLKERAKAFLASPEGGRPFSQAELLSLLKALTAEQQAGILQAMGLAEPFDAEVLAMVSTAATDETREAETQQAQAMDTFLAQLQLAAPAAQPAAQPAGQAAAPKAKGPSPQDQLDAAVKLADDLEKRLERGSRLTMPQRQAIERNLVATRKRIKELEAQGAVAKSRRAAVKQA